MMFVLATLNIIGETAWIQRMFVDDRDYPGGPDAFYGQQYAQPTKALSTNAFFVGVVINQGLIVSRGYFGEILVCPDGYVSIGLSLLGFV